MSLGVASSVPASSRTYLLIARVSPMSSQACTRPVLFFSSSSTWFLPRCAMLAAMKAPLKPPPITTMHGSAPVHGGEVGAETPAAMAAGKDIMMARGSSTSAHGVCIVPRQLLTLLETWSRAGEQASKFERERLRHMRESGGWWSH
eukprot:scaffold30792_cov63-Phaeocystis_antarctica.AAC.1